MASRLTVGATAGSAVFLMVGVAHAAAAGAAGKGPQPALQRLPFHAVDWLALAAYAGGMIGVGVYFRRRTHSADDYLLGGRSMRSWAVGMSYFVTMFSTITYLAFPGEIVQHGPLFLSSILVFPLVYLVVSRLLIPYIMRQRVTTAYELLEVRFGLSVRMLGSLYFLALRLLWMAVIVYATASVVLVPLLRLDDAATPWICAVLGLLTVAYTSLGGLPAVVWTDVAQMLILLFAALLSIVLITFQLGGIGAWWPAEWHAEWDPPNIWFDTTSRVTVASAMLSVFTWYVCTAGSDQMAVQRYLATRDLRAARQMFAVSVASNALVSGLLGVLGLALFAYFQSHPQMLPGDRMLREDADRLLPQFIVSALPVGISGLAVAGLLAAAMSSLSSGLNSACAVITVDWINRFRHTKLSGMDQVRLARFVSWTLGGAIVALAFLAGVARGNLLEISNRVTNLLTAPLFVLFALAIFVPWARPFGVWAGALASTVVAVGIAYRDWFGLGFLWIMPTSLATGVVVGSLASLVPIGRR